MNTTPNAERTHIVFIGRRNTGKSSLVNVFFGQEVSIVSEIPGTTTDPVSKAMELLPYGPVVLVDTAGIDDVGELGKKRINRTIKSISSADFAVVVLDARYPLTNEEVELFFHLSKLSLPYVVAVNKIEYGVNPELLRDLENLNLVHYEISCKENVGLEELRRRVIRKLPRDPAPPLIGDLVTQGSIVVLVVPVDSGAPKGRLILPQAQTIREALDEDTIAIVVKETELKSALNYLNVPPDLVVTDSQAIMKVAAVVPEKVKLTTFSILMARHKGDLPAFIRGLKRVEELKNGDKILIAEACSHHAQKEDIGRVKIPAWMRTHTQKDLVFEHKNGINFPEDLSEYKLIVHCGGCMLTRKMMQVRLNQIRLMDIPVVNYGVLISYMHGAIPRALLPFEEAVAEWNLRKN
jgi:[FeFe] hydrogenase H-cluster maturation GTPase HydF